MRGSKRRCLSSCDALNTVRLHWVQHSALVDLGRVLGHEHVLTNVEGARDVLRVLSRMSFAVFGACGRTLQAATPVPIPFVPLQYASMRVPVHEICPLLIGTNHEACTAATLEARPQMIGAALM